MSRSCPQSLPAPAPTPAVTPSLPPTPARTGWRLSGRTAWAGRRGGYAPAVPQAVVVSRSPSSGGGRSHQDTRAGTHRASPTTTPPWHTRNSRRYLLAPQAPYLPALWVPGGGICLPPGSDPACHPTAVPSAAAWRCATEATHLAADLGWNPRVFVPAVSQEPCGLPPAVPPGTPHTRDRGQAGAEGQVRAGGWRQPHNARRVHLTSQPRAIGAGSTCIPPGTGSSLSTTPRKGHPDSVSGAQRAAPSLQAPPWVPLCQSGAPRRGGRGRRQGRCRAAGTHRQPQGPGQQQRRRRGQRQRQRRRQEGAWGRAPEPGGPSHPPGAAGPAGPPPAAARLASFAAPALLLLFCSPRPQREGWPGPADPVASRGGPGCGLGGPEGTGEREGDPGQGVAAPGPRYPQSDGPSERSPRFPYSPPPPDRPTWEGTHPEAGTFSCVPGTRRPQGRAAGQDFSLAESANSQGGN